MLGCGSSPQSHARDSQPRLDVGWLSVQPNSAAPHEFASRCTLKPLPFAHLSVDEKPAHQPFLLQITSSQQPKPIEHQSQTSMMASIRNTKSWTQGASGGRRARLEARINEERGAGKGCEEGIHEYIFSSFAEHGCNIWR